MAKLFVNRSQAKLINEAMEMKNTVASLPTYIQESIESMSTPLSNVIDKMDLYKMVAERKQALQSHFSDDISKVTVEKIENKLSKLYAVCKKKEENLKEQLENLCYNTVVELFNLPNEGLDYEYELTDRIDFKFHIKSDTFEKFDGVEEEIAKRKLINCFIMGGAMVITNNARSLFMQELFDLDEELPHLYSKIIKLNSYLLLLQKTDITDKNNRQSGYASVTLGDSERNVAVDVKATNFPVLLTESIKGLLEIIAAYGLPDNKEVMDNVLNIADVTEDEPWHMIFGVPLWNKVIGKFGDLNTTDLPYVIKILVQQSPENFFNIINEFIKDGDNVSELVEKISDRALYLKEYDDFENTLQQKNEKSMISDNIE